MSELSRVAGIDAALARGNVAAPGANGGHEPAVDGHHRVPSPATADVRLA